MIKYDDINNKVRIIEKLFEDCRNIMRKFLVEIENSNKNKLPENDLIELKKNYTDIQKILKFLKKNIGYLDLKDEDISVFKKFLDTLLDIRNDKAHQRSLEVEKCAEHFKSIENGISVINNRFPNLVKSKYLDRIVIFNNVFSNNN